MPQNQLKRQLGLTARHGLDGLAQVVQIGSEPARYLTDRLTGMTGQTVPAAVLASQLGDYLGLPVPETSNERVIGEAAKLVASSGGLTGGAQALGRLPALFSSSPLTPATAAATSGISGGYARERGLTDTQLGLAALMAGVSGGIAPVPAMASITTANKLAEIREQSDKKPGLLKQEHAYSPETLRIGLLAAPY